MIRMILTFIIISVIFLLGAPASLDCSREYELTVSSSIYTELDFLISKLLVPVAALVNQLKMFHADMGTAPTKVNDVSNKAQTSIFSLSQIHDDTSLFIAWEDSSIIIFYRGIGQNNQTEYLGIQTQSSYYKDYIVDPATGQAIGENITYIPNGFDFRKREWYVDAKKACPPDNNGYYFCKSVVSPFYITLVNTKEMIVTFSMGFPSYTGMSKYRHTNGIMPYGEINNRDMSDDNYVGSRNTTFEGVIGVDLTTTTLTNLLENIVNRPNDISIFEDIADIGSTRVAYIMEKVSGTDIDFLLIAVSDGTPVIAESNADDSLVRLSPLQSKSSLISSSSKHIIDNSMLSDITLQLGDYTTISVRKYFKKSLRWYIVSVTERSNKNPLYTSPSCHKFTKQSSLNILLHETKTSLRQGVDAGAFLLGLIKYDLFARSKQEPAGVNLFKLGGTGQQINIQSALVAAGITFPKLRVFYIGYPDRTFIGYVLRNGRIQSFSYLDGSDGATSLEGYYARDDGYVSKPSYCPPKSQTSSYDPVQRPWYQAAAQAGYPVWSSPYEFFNSGGKIGITYSLPFYNYNNDLVGVIGIDVSLYETFKLLFQRISAINTNTIYYAMESRSSPLQVDGSSSEYNLLFSSSNANFLSPSNTLVKAWDITSVNDYMISSSAGYIRDASLGTENSAYFTSGAIDALMNTFTSYGLSWKFVAVSFDYIYSNNNNNNDDDNNINNDNNSSNFINPWTLLSLDDIRNSINGHMATVIAILVIAIAQLYLNYQLYKKVSNKQYVYFV